MKRDPDLTPLPAWKQNRAKLVAWWKRSRNRRQKHLETAGTLTRRGLTLAISLLGAILVAIGVYSVYQPAGYVVGGILLWAIQWNYGDERGKE